MVHLFRQTIVDWQMYDGIATARDNQRQEIQYGLKNFFFSVFID